MKAASKLCGKDVGEYLGGVSVWWDDEVIILVEKKQRAYEEWL